MRNLSLLFALLLTSILGAQAQTTSLESRVDTLYANNEVIPCIVKKVAADAVEYTYPGEEVVNSVYKNAVQKIVFRSGRVQQFAQSLSVRPVKGIDDIDMVTLTEVPNDVQGLVRLGQVSAKAKGTTNIANQERVKARAYRKLKAKAVMMGANVLYITNIRNQGNTNGTEYVAAESAETNLDAVAYTSQLPIFADFQKLVGENRFFYGDQKAKLWDSDSDVNVKFERTDLAIGNIYEEGGLIFVQGKLKGVDKVDTFRVTAFDDTHFYLYYTDKSTTYSYRILLNSGRI